MLETADTCRKRWVGREQMGWEEGEGRGEGEEKGSHYTLDLH